MRVWKQRPRNSRVRQWRGAEILTCDALEVLSAIRDSTVDLLFLDPPFNLGKRYGSRGPSKDNRPEGQYAGYLYAVLKESVRVLAEGGAVYLYHLPTWGIRAGSFLMEHLAFRHWIAISMKNGFPSEGRLYPAHYSLLYFTKGEPTVFDRPKVPAPRCRHCERYIKDYGGYEKYIRNGINLSDVWDDISPVRHPVNKHRNANQLPPRIADRVVYMSGKPGGVFLDPFVGTGTTVISAYQHGMRVIAGDIEPRQGEIAMQRLQEEGRKEPHE